MPVSWRVDVPSQRAFLSFTDPYNLDEWTAAMVGLLQTPELRPGFGLFVDRRGVAAPSAAFVETMTDFFRDHLRQLSGARAAIVVDSDAVYGMARMTAILTDMRAAGYTVEVFKDARLAERWLSSAEPDFVEEA